MQLFTYMGQGNFSLKEEEAVSYKAGFPFGRHCYIKFFLGDEHFML